MFNNLQELKNRASWLENVIKIKEHSRATPIAGKLCVRKKRNTFQYYHRTKPEDKTGRYIKKSNLGVACRLAQQEYNKKVLAAARKELRHLNIYIKCRENSAPEDLYKTLPEGLRNLIKPILEPDEVYVEKWMAIPYEKLGFREDDTSQHYTQLNERVRSKTEINIANLLFYMHIPYRYEKPLTLKNGFTIHPDFTILDIKNRRELYLEHLGSVDDPDYMTKALKKVNGYEETGLYLGESLLLTGETKNIPVNLKQLEKMLRHVLSL